MDTPHIENFLSEVFQEAIRIRAYLCLFSHQMYPDETNENDGQITPTQLMWNHSVALHNSNRAVHQCGLDLSKESECDVLIASALIHVGGLVDIIEEKTSFVSIAQTGRDELLETAVRAQAALEILVGSWQTIRQIFKQHGDEHKRNASHQAARSAGIAAAGWRVLYEALLLEYTNESNWEYQGLTRDQTRQDINPLEPRLGPLNQAILDAWSKQEQEPCQYTLMADAGTNSFLLGCYMVRAWLEKTQDNSAYVFVPSNCFRDEVDKIVRAVTQISRDDPKLVVEYFDSKQPINIDGMVCLVQIDYAQMLARPYLDFYKENQPKRLLLSHEPTGQWIDPPAGMMQLLRHNSPAPLYWNVVRAAGKGQQRFKDLRHTEWYNKLVTLFNLHSPISDHYLVCMYLSILASEAMSQDELSDDFWKTGKVGQYMKTIRRRELKGMDVEHLLDSLREHPENLRGSFSHIMFELVRNGVLRVPNYADAPDLLDQAQRFREAVLPIATQLLEEEDLMYPKKLSQTSNQC